MRNKLFLAAAVAVTMASCKKEASPSFTADKSTVETGEVVTFTNTSEDSYNQVWDFGDGTQSEALNPTHVYGEAGTYKVTLQVTDKKGKEAFTSEPTTITVNNSNFDEMAEEDQMAMEARVLEVVGTWNLLEYQHDNSETTGTDFETEYEASTAEFLSDGEIIFTNDEGNVSTGYWDLTGLEYMTISLPSAGLQNNFYKIVSIGSTMVLEHVQHYEDINGNAQTNTYTLTFSK